VDVRMWGLNEWKKREKIFFLIPKKKKISFISSNELATEKFNSLYDSSSSSYLLLLLSTATFWIVTLNIITLTDWYIF